MRIEPVEYEFKDRQEFPALFSGYVAVGYAGGRWYSGCDTESKDDAVEKMVDAARLAMMPAAHVEKSLDPSFYPHSVRVFRVDTA